MIDSVFEGTFMERVAPGAFAHSLAHDRSRLRVLFQHGRDPQIGDKPLGVPTLLREDEQGATYEVQLLDPTTCRSGSLASAQACTARFRFKVLREDSDQKPPASSYNETGLPERTIREAKLMEFGPVTFPAYEGATRLGEKAHCPQYWIGGCGDPTPHRLAMRPSRSYRCMRPIPKEWTCP